MNTFDDLDHKRTHFHAGDMLRCVLRGAPFVWTNEDLLWHSVRVPRFPVVFSLLSGIFWSVMTAVKAAEVPRQPVSPRMFAFPSIMSLIFYGVFFLALNAVIMGGFWVVLTQFTHSSGEIRKRALLAGAQRVSYFSTFFQPIFFLSLAVPFLLPPYPTTSAWVDYAFLSGMIACGILRLVAVFQAMRHETGGSILAGLFALFFCFDLWGSFFPMVCGYVW